MPRYPHITLPMAGDDGKAFAILGRATRAAKAAGLSNQEIEEFRQEILKGDYDHLLQTCMAWFTVE